MKNYYLLLMCSVALFCTNLLSAQSCPPTGFSNATSLYFFYNAGTSLCVDRPVTVTAESSEFTLVDCGDAYSVYDLSIGAPLANPNMFVADFGYATCEYTNGTLTAETLSVEQVEFILKSLKVFPNPVTNGNSISIKAPVNIEADVKLYNLTGKLVFENNVENINSKSISLSNLPNGVYMLQITINNTAITQKIVIMK